MNTFLLNLLFMQWYASLVCLVSMEERHYIDFMGILEIDKKDSICVILPLSAYSIPYHFFSFYALSLLFLPVIILSCTLSLSVIIVFVCPRDPPTRDTPPFFVVIHLLVILLLVVILRLFVLVILFHFSLLYKRMFRMEAMQFLI